MKPVFIILFSLFFCDGNAQTIDSNRIKYQTYKNNLKYFRVVGEGAKRSIIGERRGGLLSFGDGGVNQGWYIGVLATEYAVFTKDGKQVEAQKTLAELYYALLSINRLDAVAQSRYDQDSIPNYSGPLNAIALRTDGWSDIPDKAYYKAINEKNRGSYPVDFKGEHWVDITTMERQFYSPPHKHDYFSQDQLYHVLMGLYLTYFYVPQTAKVKIVGIDTLVDLNTMAKDIALRFIETVADHHFKLKIPSGKTAFGGNAIIYANPLINLAKAMGSDYKFKKRNNPFWNLSGGIGASWPLNKTDLAHMHLVMASISDARFSITRSNAKAIYRQAKDKTYSWQAFYPLLHNNLWGEKPMTDKYYQLVEEVLNSAPMINPQNNVGVGGPKGWRAYPKFMKSKEDQDDGNGWLFAKFSGIDYMLLYNLYQLRGFILLGE